MAPRTLTAPRHLRGLAVSWLLVAGCWELKPDTDRRDASLDVAFDVADARADSPKALTDGAGDAPQDVLPDVAPDAAMDVAPDVAVDVAPDAAMDVVPDAAVDVAPDVASDTPADLVPDVAMDIAPDAPPDGPADVARDADAATPADVAPTTTPRPVLPPSGGRVFNAAPMFEVEPPTGITEITVEVCRTRACTAGDLVGSFPLMRVAGGTRLRGRLPTAIPTSGRYWWRAWAMMGATRVASSPVWAFRLQGRVTSFDPVIHGPLDVNGDGVSDLVAICDGATKLYRGAGGLSASNLVAAGVTIPSTALAAAGDLDGDGFGDVAWVLPDGASGGPRVVQAFRGSASGLVATPLTLSLGADMLVRSFVPAGDFNRDGFADFVIERVLAGATPRQVTVIYGGPTGLSLGPTLSALAPVAAGASTTDFGAAGVGDFDGDGYEDLAVGAPGASGTGYESVSRVYSNGTFDAPVATYNALGFPRVAADVNGDGYLDALVTRGDVVTAVYGHGERSPAPCYTPSAPAVAAWDVNNDRTDDIVAVGRFTSGPAGQIGVYNSRTTMGAGSAYSTIVSQERQTGDAADGVCAGDYDGDDEPDFVIHALERVGVNPHTSLRFHRTIGGVFNSSFASLVLDPCTALLAW